MQMSMLKLLGFTEGVPKSSSASLMEALRTLRAPDGGGFALGLDLLLRDVAVPQDGQRLEPYVGHPECRSRRQLKIACAPV